MSLRVLPTERPDAWEVQGRGELQLAILVETMRREGFELTVGKPQVLTRRIDGVLCEPLERASIDVPEEFLGVVTQLLALRRGRLEQIVNHGTGWARMEYLVPARGLVGFRTEFLTETRGTGLLHHVFDRWEPWMGEIRSRPRGSLVSDRAGVTVAFALFTLQERGTLFVGPGRAGLRGHDRGGEQPGRRPRRQPHQGEEAHQHALLHLRRAGAAGPAPPRCRSDQALEFVRDDECVEVTPGAVRLRKVELAARRAPSAPGGPRPRRPPASASLRPLGSQRLHLGHDGAPLRAVGRIVGKTLNLGGELVAPTRRLEL